jgi:hypothetical protein
MDTKNFPQFAIDDTTPFEHPDYKQEDVATKVCAEFLCTQVGKRLVPALYERASCAHCLMCYSSLPGDKEANDEANVRALAYLPCCQGFICPQCFITCPSNVWKIECPNKRHAMKTPLLISKH